MSYHHNCAVRHGMDVLFINHTETPYNYHALAYSSNYTDAMDRAGEIIKNLSAIVHEYFPSTKIIVSVGNNDVVPDYFLELKEEDSPLGNLSLSVEDAGMLGVLYDAFSKNHTKNNGAILNPDDKWTFLRGGYYSTMIHDGKLIILSLNTVLYANYYNPEPLNTDDPGKQFLWMRKMLKYARERNCQVLIIGHIPPTLGSYRHNQFWKDQYVHAYYSLIEEYDDLVIGQLFGHLHSDEFRVNDNSLVHVNTDGETNMIPDISSPLLLGPSVTPIHGNHPSFRMVKYASVGSNDRYSKGRFKLLDYDSFNYPIGSDENWTKLYSFSDAYSSTYTLEGGLSASTMKSIVESIDKSMHIRESPLLISFRSYIMSGATSKSQHAGLGVACNEQCKDEWLCTIKSATRVGYDTCLILRQESRGKATTTLVISLAAIVAIVGGIVFMVRRRREHKRNHYEETASVETSIEMNV